MVQIGSEITKRSKLDSEEEEISKDLTNLAELLLRQVVRINNKK